MGTRSIIEIRDGGQDTVTTIYKGELEKAFELFIKEFEDGCHIKELPEAWEP